MENMEKIHLGRLGLDRLQKEIRLPKFILSTLNIGVFHFYRGYTEKKVEPKRLHPGAVFEKGATLEGEAVFFTL